MIDLKTTAIMQPTFLPWVGYFALIDRVDEFIYLDHVQFDKRSWQQRNKIKTPNGSIWVTVPVVTKGLSGQSIADVVINQSNPDFPEKLIRSIEHNYKKAPFFSQYSPEVFALLRQEGISLRDLNCSLIDFYCGVVGIEAPKKFSSSMSVDGNKAALLVDICQKVDTNVYISPKGSENYISCSSDFDEAGIVVEYFEYEHPVWQQLYGEFDPYMCFLDLLFNVGDEGLEIIRSGVISEETVCNSC